MDIPEDCRVPLREERDLHIHHCVSQVKVRALRPALALCVLTLFRRERLLGET